MKPKKQNKNRNKNFIRRNEQIKINKVLLIKDGENLGVYPTFEALRIAKEEGLDLVEVAPNAKPPVCQVMDYGKFLYDQQKKNKKQKTTHKEKIVTFRYVIDDNDLQTKANKVRQFLEKGYKVKLVVKFRAREKAHKNEGFVTIKKCLGLLEDIATIEKPVAMEGSNVTCRLEKKSHSTKS